MELVPQLLRLEVTNDESEFITVGPFEEEWVLGN
jgi:hypothetical protein